MKFTYFRKTGEIRREVNGEQEWDGDEGYDFDYEAEYSEVESALQNIIYDNFFSDITKNEEIRKKIQSSIYKFLSRIDVLEPLAEEFRDDIQDYFEEAALESEESI